MRVAIPEWQGRVSPVFDVAVSVLLIEVDGVKEVRREERTLLRKEVDARVDEFLSMGAEILICGAISATLEEKLADSGVRVIGFIRGMVDEVLAAYLYGELEDQVFMMPGCQRLDRQGESALTQGNGIRLGHGSGGRGPGRSQRGVRGKSGGLIAAEPSAFCPTCGEKTPSTLAQPRKQIVCPKCGTPIV